MSEAPKLTKEQIKKSILQAAQDIAAAEGWEAVTVRKVAEHIGYAPPIIYQYFENKADMLTQLGTEVYASILESIMSAATQAGEDPTARLRAIGWAYWQYSQLHPAQYALIRDTRLFYSQAPTFQSKEHALFGFTSSEILRLNPKIAPAKIEECVIEIWAAVHGLISLYIGGLFTGEERAEKFFRVLLDDQIRILKLKK